MLKDYRRRFILSNMALSGLVLLVTFAVLASANIRADYSELRNTMSIIVKPFESQIDKIFSDEENDPEVKKSTHDEPSQNDKHRDHHHSGAPSDERVANEVGTDTYDLFTTAIFHKDSGIVSIISEGTTVDSEIIQKAVREVNLIDSDFGRLREYDLYYYAERTPFDTKVALVSTSYITMKIVRTVLFLTGIFIVLMGFIACISINLSKVAVKPLEQAIEMERNFVADISHDLKTPITIVLTNNSILKSNPSMDFEERKQWMESTDAAAKNMMKLVNEMLTLSSLESVERKVEKERVNLSMAAEKCLLQLESLAYEQDITIKEDIREDVFIESTSEYTERICTGLIENALKYEPKGGSIEISVLPLKKSSVIRVKNSGSTISPEDLPHVFERFYRGDKARSGSGGHGLGLPIIKQITELIGADITAESNDNGTTFTVYFTNDE